MVISFVELFLLNPKTIVEFQQIISSRFLRSTQVTPFTLVVTT